MYSKKTIYVVGSSRTNVANAITENFNGFFVGFIIDITTDKIIDLSCSATIRTTNEFVYSLFINKSIDKYDEKLENEIKQRYYGSSQKAIIVAYKDAFKKYKNLKHQYL